MVAFLVDKNGKKGAINTRLEVIVDCIYDDIDFVCTRKGCFICYHNGSNYVKLNCDARCKALFIETKEVIQLECRITFKCKEELENLGY